MKANTEFSGRIVEVDYERSMLLIRYEGLSPEVGTDVVLASEQENGKGNQLVLDASRALCPCRNEPAGCHPRCVRRNTEGA